MNNGMCTKHFISCGKNTLKSMTKITDKWKHGYFDVIDINLELDSSFSQRNIDKLKQDNDDNWNFIAIDNDETAFRRMIEYISYFNQNYGGVEVLAILIVDSTESPISAEMNKLHEDLKQVACTDFIHVHKCKANMIGSLVAMYNHLFCGFTLACVDFADVFYTLNAGCHFQASQVTAKAANELPLAVFETISSIPRITNRAYELKCLSMVIISNNDFSISLYEACNAILRGCIAGELNVSYVSNINMQLNNEHYILIGAVFDKKIPTPF